MSFSCENSSFNNSMDLFEDVDEHKTNVLDGNYEEQSSSTSYFTFQCPFCNESFSDELNLHTHIESIHPEDGVENPSLNAVSTFRTAGEENEISAIEYFVCPYCSTSYKTKEALAQHFTSIHAEELDLDDLEEMLRSLDFVLCPMCKHICSSALEIQQHIDIQHSSRKNSQKNLSGKEASANLSAVSRVTMCPICGLEEPDSDLLTSHIELHFDTSSGLAAEHQEPSFPSTSRNAASVHASSSSTSSVSSKSSSSGSSRGKNYDKRKRNGNHYKRQYKQGLEKAVVNGKMSPGDYHDQIVRMQESDLMTGVDDGHSKVEGLIPHLESFYRNRSREGQSAVLCSAMDYYCGSYGDKGWGCGYRNFQMMLSCLSRIQLYSTKLFKDGRIRIPSIPKIQEMIETAWQRGFDREGCLQLEAKVVNTCKWIGATEIVATLSSIGIRCELIDFPWPSSPDGTHPRLLQWVKDYFCKDQNAKPPLYLQHQGHSRTVIGVEVDKGITRLLLFDPGSSKDHMASLKSDQMGWKQMSSFRRNLAAFKAKQYQIVSVVGLLSGEDYENSKRLTSKRIL